MDKFYKNLWTFFLVVTVFACFFMAVLFVLNNSALKSDEIRIEEREAISGITYELWDSFKISVLIMVFMLLISYLIYIKFANQEKNL